MMEQQSGMSGWEIMGRALEPGQMSAWAMQSVPGQNLRESFCCIMPYGTFEVVPHSKAQGGLAGYQHRRRIL